MRGRLLAAAALVALVTGGVPGAVPVSAGPLGTAMVARSFVPPVNIVTDGNHTFTNLDIEAHWVASPSGCTSNCVWDTGLMVPGVSRTVLVSGAIESFFCRIHSVPMQGLLVRP